MNNQNILQKAVEYTYESRDGMRAIEKRDCLAIYDRKGRSVACIPARGGPRFEGYAAKDLVVKGLLHAKVGQRDADLDVSFGDRVVEFGFAGRVDPQE